jgi:hypothetical protein
MAKGLRAYSMFTLLTGFNLSATMLFVFECTDTLEDGRQLVIDESFAYGSPSGQRVAIIVQLGPYRIL